MDLNGSANLHLAPPSNPAGGYSSISLSALYCWVQDLITGDLSDLIYVV